MTEFAETSAYIQRLWVLYLCPPVWFLTLKLFFYFSAFFYLYINMKTLFKIFSHFMTTFFLPFAPFSPCLLRQQALLAAISEKDANIALLELSSSKRKKAQEEVMALKREKDRLMHQLKQQVQPPQATTPLFKHAYKR